MIVAIVIIAICLAIYGIFSFLELNLKYKSFEVDKALLEFYGKEMLPDVINGVTEQVSNRLTRYMIKLVSEGVLSEDECQKAITKAGEAYHEELKRD